MYDFLNDEFPDGQRIPYKLIRYQFLRCYYIYCSSKFSVSKRIFGEWVGNEHESAFAYDNLELSFELPIENLMLEVISTIMAGGRQSAQFEQHTQKRIVKILDGRKIGDLLGTLDGDELAEFRADLALLRLM
ncbi:hypothetical protein [Massilia rubra]|uniref:Uncharacterized protein n=1 Tax=Massilia rubra TaxID=2607910 RepID=A0ABX0LQ93_9BURK|nr:hypothetical protein [Massilia rubra]NHZ36758.1 hypothetical protein [Massilia rubra]